MKKGRSAAEHTEVLGMEVDISKKYQEEKPDLTIRLQRPRNFSKPVEPPVSEYVAEAGAPDAEADLQRVYEESMLTEEQSEKISSADDDAIEDIIKKVEWGDFDVEKIVKLLVEISKHLTGVILLPYQLPFQERIFRSVLLNDGATITGLWSRQAGKTEASACAAVTLCVVMPALARHVFPDQLQAYKDGFKVGVYAPTGEQAHTLYSRILLRARSESSHAVYDDPEIDTKLEKYGCRWTNGSFVFHQSASLQSSVESKTYHLLITDETQGLSEYVINKSLEPMLAWNNGTFVHIGTTSEHPCLFYDVIQKNKMADTERPEDKQTHFEYDFETVLKYNPRYKAHVERQLEKYGRHSRFFQMSYCLRWFFEEGMAVTDRDLKDFTMHVPVGLTKYTDAPCVVGIDLARKTNSSVVTVLQLLRTEVTYDEEVNGNRLPENTVYVKVCDWLEINNVPYSQQRDMMKAFLRPYSNIKYITVDATRDDAMFEQMEIEWDFTRNMESFIFSPKSKNYLMNLFYEYFWKQRIIIPSTEQARKNGHWQNFYLQMINLERITTHGYTYLVKGHRENCRDDYPDSLFLALHSARMATQYSTPVEMVDMGNLFSVSRKHPEPGFAGIRKAVRDGTYRPQGRREPVNLRKQRVEKLIGGILK